MRTLRTVRSDCDLTSHRDLGCPPTQAVQLLQGARARQRLYRARCWGSDWEMRPSSIAWRSATAGEVRGATVLSFSSTERALPSAFACSIPTGSEFERSGNGLRILASYLAAEGLVAGEPFDVEVGGDTVQFTGPWAAWGRVCMTYPSIWGRIGYGPGAVGLDPAALDSEGTDRSRPGGCLISSRTDFGRQPTRSGVSRGLGFGKTRS